MKSLGTSLAPIAAALWNLATVATEEDDALRDGPCPSHAKLVNAGRIERARFERTYAAIGERRKGDAGEHER